ELHHREAHALGGPDSVDNLELRCPPHNLLAAEQDLAEATWSAGAGRCRRASLRGKVPPSLAAREGAAEPRCAGRCRRASLRGKVPPSLAAREGSDRAGGGARSDP